MWTTLKHCGVLFPPEYEPHGVRMLYDGAPVVLTPDQEEVATMFAVMKDSDYAKKQVFLDNFWSGFKEVLGKNHVIKSLDKCDFTAIFEHFDAQREAKKLLTKEVGGRGRCTHSLSTCVCPQHAPLHPVSDRSTHPCHPHLTPQEKAKIKEDRDAMEAKYKVAYVDGRTEPVCLSCGMLGAVLWG